MSTSSTYTLCLSFTRSGHDRRVPWLFVIYPTGATRGIRLRAKDITEPDCTSATNTDTPPPKYAFLARENAYVDNYSCWGRVILRTAMSPAEAAAAQATIEKQPLSDVVPGARRDCQKWVAECLPALGFDERFTSFWYGQLSERGTNIWDLERGVEQVLGLKFIHGQAYRSRAEVIGA